MKKKISISGASGFVGNLLVKELKKKKYELELIKTKKILNRNFGYDSSHFIHVGFDTRKDKCNVDDQVKIIKNIILKAKKYNFKIIFLSTACCGSKNNRKLYKFNKYQVGKYLCEKELKKEKKSINFIIFRVFNLYGIKKNKKNIVYDIKKKILATKNSKIKIFHPKSTRDFIYVDDLISLLLKSLKQKTFKNEIYEVGTTKSTSIENLYKKINRILNKSSSFIKAKPEYDKIRHSKAIIKLTKKRFNWSPKYNLDDGLKKILN